MTTSGSNVPEPVPEGRETRASRRGKSCSRDLISALDARMSRVEVAVGDIRDRLDVQEEHVEELNGQDEELKGEVQEMVREMLENVAERNSQLESVVEIMQRELEDLRAEVRAARAEGGYEAAARPEVRLEVPKPKEFCGKRDAKEIDNFLWGLSSDTALLWWRRRCDDRLGGALVRTWVDFQCELRKQFYPEYAMDEARGKLRRLVQRGDVREYVREFSDLALQVGDLGEREALFTFMDGLKPWAKQELQRRGVQDLTCAMAVAEGLIDYSCPDKDRTEPTKPRDKGKGWADKGKQSRDEDGGNGKPQSPWKGNSAWKGKPSGSKEEKPKNCFLCEGPHFVRDYPQRAKLAAIASEDEEQQGDETVRLGSMQLGAVRKGGKQAKGLMYADMVVAGQHVEALVDTGASDLFVSEQGAAKLDLKADSAGGWVKTVNSKWVRIKGIAKGIDVQLGEWHGTEDIEVIQMDDYEVVMGLNFLERIQALLVPHEDSICIVGSKGQCVVPVRRGCAQSTKTLTAIQLAEGEQICAVVRSVEDTPGNIVEAPDEVLEASEHQLGGANPVAGEPSREATPPASSKVRAELLPHIKEGKAPDPIQQPILESAEAEKTKLAHVSDGLGRAKVDRLHEPQHGGLRRLPLKECRDIGGAGHSGTHRTSVSCPPCSTRHAGSRESSMTRRGSAAARPRWGNIDTRARGRVSRDESAHGQKSRRGAQLEHPRARRALETAKGPRVSEGSVGEVLAKDPGRPAPLVGKVSSVRQEGLPHVLTFHPTKAERAEGPNEWDAQEAQSGARRHRNPLGAQVGKVSMQASRMVAQGARMDSAGLTDGVGLADSAGGAQRTLTAREGLVRAHMSEDAVSLGGGGYHGARFRPVDGAGRCGGVMEHGGVSLGVGPPWGVPGRRKLLARVLETGPWVSQPAQLQADSPHSPDSQSVRGPEQPLRPAPRQPAWCGPSTPALHYSTSAACPAQQCPNFGTFPPKAIPSAALAFEGNFGDFGGKTQYK
ncbi:Uncharacterized protein TCM_027814 [Theobroma cacao]|uniref:Retrotransposon gag domain-containing protein n=1 Tax=Theobroma cacao TaxID=3641 RepID=A0A061GGZ1_THECC|nr:Uncharacterized protein TCM_027814 [Theobroma cacao]